MMTSLTPAARLEKSCPNRLIAVDIGNTAWKFGLFDAPAYDRANLNAPYPFSLDDWRDDEPDFPNLARKLGAVLRHGAQERLDWAIASVNRHRTVLLRDWLAQRRPNDSAREILTADLPLANPYDRPGTLGVDRLLAALAASKLFPDSDVLVVDIGTATKIDYVDSSGRFAGGAILPGPATAAGALFERTERLPNVVEIVRGTPIYPATNTRQAIETGIVGSQLGAILYFYRRLRDLRPDRALPVVLTGRGSIGRESELESLLRAERRDEGGKEKKTAGRTVWTTRDLVLTGIFLASGLRERLGDQ